MAHYNVLSKKVTLQTDVTKGQILSIGGNLATTGSTTDEPFGIAQYDGAAGEIIAVTCIGLEDVAIADAELGDGIKANAGAAEKATSGEAAFATVVEVNSAQSAEILIK